MNIVIILIVVICVVGIILLSGKSPFEKKSREQNLQSLAKFLEGKLEPIEDEAYDNSFRIKFRFSGVDFVFEDWEKQGFKDKVYSCFLYAQIPGKFMLTFSPKEKPSKIKSDIFIASQVSSNVSDGEEPLELPKFLKDFQVTTHDTRDANKFLDDGKVAAIYKHYRRIDTRGNGVMPIQIANGRVSLEFYADTDLEPNIKDLYHHIPVMENHLNRMSALIRQVKKF